jgi:hypothetical protein
LSWSLTPPKRKPSETWAFSRVPSVSFQLAIRRGTTPSASTLPGLLAGSAKMPSNTCVRSSV